mgnify:CR=1 FL=1|tara:strand:- start:3731 stop:4270 length:540 start_codon:yes stop_codon:yes gene_type:complete
MKIFLVIILLFFQGCAKNNTVMVCGDHICINKEEAKQYFEENLSIEVKIVDRKKNKQIDLVELNLKNNSTEKQKITINSKKNTNKEIKILSDKEIENIKAKIKKDKKIKKIAKKKVIIEDKPEKLISKKIEKKSEKTYKKNIQVVDVCTILDKCSIEEISKYLLKQGKNKDFPKLTLQE